MSIIKYDFFAFLDDETTYSSLLYDVFYVGHAQKHQMLFNCFDEPANYLIPFTLDNMKDEVAHQRDMLELLS